jgi:hypothetical protein
MTSEQDTPSRQHFETLHYVSSDGQAAEVTLWLTTAQALPGLEGIPHRDTFAASWQVPGEGARRWCIPVRAGCTETLTSLGLPHDVATWVDGVLWTDLDEAADYWRRRGWDTGDLFD